mmetsp:Transcript_4075/g.9584  ORF Transcript_4075/g.9584 Transcript_4075/m.9584 type:complete len:208 (-) Transcript_4075:504-1127(-)
MILTRRMKTRMSRRRMLTRQKRPAKRKRKLRRRRKWRTRRKRSQSPSGEARSVKRTITTAAGVLQSAVACMRIVWIGATSVQLGTMPRRGVRGVKLMVAGPEGTERCADRRVADTKALLVARRPIEGVAKEIAVIGGGARMLGGRIVTAHAEQRAAGAAAVTSGDGEMRMPLACSAVVAGSAGSVKGRGAGDLQLQIAWQPASAPRS